MTMFVAGVLFTLGIILISYVLFDIIKSTFIVTRELERDRINKEIARVLKDCDLDRYTIIGLKMSIASLKEEMQSSRKKK